LAWPSPPEALSSSTPAPPSCSLEPGARRRRHDDAAPSRPFPSFSLSPRTPGKLPVPFPPLEPSFPSLPCDPVRNRELDLAAVAPARGHRAPHAAAPCPGDSPASTTSSRAGNRAELHRGRRILHRVAAGRRKGLLQIRRRGTLFNLAVHSSSSRVSSFPFSQLVASPFDL